MNEEQKELLRLLERGHSSPSTIYNILKVKFPRISKILVYDLVLAKKSANIFTRNLNEGHSGSREPL